MKRDVSRIKSCSAPSRWPAAPIKIVNEEELRGHAKRGTKERRKGGGAARRGQIIIIYDYKRRRDNWAEITPPQGRAIYKAFMGDETIFMLS